MWNFSPVYLGTGLDGLDLMYMLGPRPRVAVRFWDFVAGLTGAF